MIMITTIKEKPNKNFKLPCLLINKEDNLVVLANSYTGSSFNGIVLYEGSTSYEKGHVSDKWTTDVFELFTDELILSND